MKISLFLVGSTLITWVSLSFAQTAEDYVVPRTEWGQPDLQGVWNFSSNVPLQRPTQFGDREFMTDDEVTQLRACLLYTSDAADE